MEKRVGRKVVSLVLVMVLVLSIAPCVALAEHGSGSIRVDISLQPLLPMGSGYEFHFMDLLAGEDQDQSQTKEFHITNTGESELTGLSVSLVNPDNLDSNVNFEVIQAPAEALAAGANTKFIVELQDPISAHGKHVATVSVSADQLSQPYEFTVHILVDPEPDDIPEGQRVSSIEVYGEDDADTIETKGGTLQLYATVLPDDAVNPRVWWSIPSKDEEYIVASINRYTGELYARGNGAVTVRATGSDRWEDNIFGELTITISGQDTPAKLVSGITVNSAGNATEISSNGGTLQMSADVQPSDADDTTVTWSISSGGGFATINSSGLLTAKANGTVTIRAAAADGSGKYSDFTVTISGQTAAQATVNKYDVYTSPSPSDGGYTSGGGNYSENASCTVTAYANTGYRFASWTENGTYVSGNSSYTFTVNKSRTLIANFEYYGSGSYGGAYGYGYGGSYGSSYGSSGYVIDYGNGNIMPMSAAPAATAPTATAPAAAASNPAVTAQTAPAIEVKGAVLGRNINVREEASSKSGRVGRLQDGDDVSVLEYEDGFYKIKWENEAGYAYVSADYLNVTFSEPMEMSVSGRVNIQSRMNAASKYRVDTLRKGDIAIFIGRYKSWWIVEVEGENAYVKNGKYIKS